MRNEYSRTTRSPYVIGTEDFSEPGIVLDIVLDDSHPLFKNAKLGKISIPEDFPVNYKNEKSDENDLDYGNIGTAVIRLCYTQQNQNINGLIYAVPLDRSTINFPLLNEVVMVYRILGKYYYSNRVNFNGLTNTSANFYFEQSYGKNTEGLSVDGPLSILDSDNSLEINKSYRGFLGKYFWFNNKIRSLKRFEGDVILEGRFGQSIRMGAYDDDRKNDIGSYSDYKDPNSTKTPTGRPVGGGNPMILIRNRQRPIASDKENQIHPKLNKIPSIKNSISEKNAGGYILEDINNDGSSIYITSGLTTPTFRTTCYKPFFSQTNEKTKSAFYPTGATNFKFPILNGDQIIINSDRLLFSSRFGEIINFSKKRYMITTDSEFSVDAHDQIVLTTNKKTVINSPAIYLGEYDNTNEPAVLGQTAVNWMYELCNWLLKHTHYYDHVHPLSGGPTPNFTQLPVEIQQLVQLQQNLHSLLSRRVFLTGGGFAPGTNGSEIKDGVSPTQINSIDSESSVSGVPGGWVGRNKR